MTTLIKVAAVKELRDRTGAGVMDCKQALQGADGDIEKAIQDMRKSGIAKAARKSGRIASEGLVMIKRHADPARIVIIEINSETDFVAKDQSFNDFCDAVATCILVNRPADLSILMGSQMVDCEQTVEEGRQQLVARVGEHISVRRFSLLDAEKGRFLNSYAHGTRIGVIIELEGGDDGLAKDIAMHIAASNPICISAEDMPQEIVAKEREVVVAQAEASSKPADIIEKITDGRMQKFFQEQCLLGQSFVKDPEQTIGQLLKSSAAMVKNYVRYEVGEGLEKKNDNFVQEVMSQAKGA